MRIFKHIHYPAAVLLAAIIFGGCVKENLAPKAATNSSANEEMVYTPAGLMQKSNVHYIEPGSELQLNGGHIQKIQSSSGKMLEDFGEVAPGENKLHFGDDASAYGIVPKTVNGWAAYSYWSNSKTTTPVTSFTSNWVVPAAPSTKSGQLIYLFNGMQDGTTSTSYIIQPVLQWGVNSASGGGYNWAVTNWYVTSKSAFFGPLVNVSTGTSIKGVMTETGVSGKNYNYSCAFTVGSSTSTLTVSKVPQATWLAETLEVYNVSKANQYPNQASMPFTGINILEGSTNPTISWTAVAATGSSLPSATIGSNSSSNGTVTINF